MTRLAITAVAGLVALAACKDGRPDAEARTKSPADEAAEPEQPSDAASEDDAGPEAALSPPRALPDEPLGLPDRDLDDSRRTRAAVALGETLFFDSRLSASGRTACASCHDPKRGWSTPVAHPRTDSGKLNARHAPTLWLAARAGAWPWDGQTTDLANMVLVHWRGQLGDPAQGIARVGDYPGYQAHFQRAFGANPSPQRAAQALASFLQVVETGGSPWDRYEAGDRKAVSPDVIAGFEVFRNIAQCALCHSPPLYTDHDFHRLAIADDRADPGRMRATGRPTDRGAFKTPTLRGLVHTAPYLHDGSAVSLEEVLERKLSGGIKTGDPTVDRRLADVRLDPVQKRQLLAFLRALSRPEQPTHKRPEMPEPPAYDAGVPDAPPSP